MPPRPVNISGALDILTFYLSIVPPVLANPNVLKDHVFAEVRKRIIRKMIRNPVKLVGQSKKVD